jgi:hypothetical protein
MERRFQHKILGRRWSWWCVSKDVVGVVGVVMVRCDGVFKTVRRVCAILNSYPVGHYLFSPARAAVPFR